MGDVSICCLIAITSGTVRGFVELAQRLAAFVPRSCYAQPSHGSDIPAQLVKRRESVHRPQAVKLQAGLCQAWVSLTFLFVFTLQPLFTSRQHEFAGSQPTFRRRR